MSGANILVTGYASFDSFILIDHFCGEGKTSTVLAFEGLGTTSAWRLCMQHCCGLRTPWD